MIYIYIYIIFSSKGLQNNMNIFCFIIYITICITFIVLTRADHLFIHNYIRYIYKRINHGYRMRLAVMYVTLIHTPKLISGS